MAYCPYCSTKLLFPVTQCDHLGHVPLPFYKSLAHSIQFMIYAMIEYRPGI